MQGRCGKVDKTVMPAGVQSERKQYAKVFLICFGIMIVVMLPLMIYNKGIFLYYGDFNSQQLPFYTHAHDMVRSGKIFWDWGTDLGSNFIGSYSFYLLGSPFFWLTLPFPSKAVVYLIPWLLAIKTGVAGITSYAFARRFVKSQNACIIAGILYALSGFQLYNVFFNHFHDVVAFFPLLLIALEERVKNDRRGVFALSVALCALINYFFFTGQITFLIIYFFCRLRCDDFNINLRKFFGLIVEAVIGVMIACVMLLPAALAITDNPRVDSILLGHDMIVYNDKFRIWRIIQSFFMLSDPPARSNLFSSNTARWASIAGYLPLFSMAGVIAFMRQKKKHWMKSVITVCIIFAFIPILNSSFYAFNSGYYARWFYMPVLIMSVMTAYVLDSRSMKLSKGVPVCIGMVVFFAVAGILPQKVDGDKLKFADLPADKLLFWISIAVTVIGLVGAGYLAWGIGKNRRMLRRAVILTSVGAFMCAGAIVWYGVAQGPYQSQYINEAINGKDRIILNEDEFFRVDMAEYYDNYPMFWGYSSMRAFHSIVPGSIMEFYNNIGITRDVASRVPTQRFALRGLFSTKYYFARKDQKPPDMYGFEKIGTQNNFDIYENQNFVPMGFTYNYYVTDEDFKSRNTSLQDKMLMEALVLDKFQQTTYQTYLRPLPERNMDTVYSREEYVSDCVEKRNNCAYSFETSSRGFVAKINMKSDNLVFFSVPYEKGWTAKVNGQKATVEKVSGGFMAVLAPKGDNVTIEFSYMTNGLIPGILITVAGIIILVVYVKVWGRKHPSENNRCEYKYRSIDDMPETIKEPIDDKSIGSEEQ